MSILGVFVASRDDPVFGEPGNEARRDAVLGKGKSLIRDERRGLGSRV